MAIQNRRAIANRLNREHGNAPAHPSEAERAAKPARAPAKAKARKRGR